MRTNYRICENNYYYEHMAIRYIPQHIIKIYTLYYYEGSIVNSTRKIDKQNVPWASEEGPGGGGGSELDEEDSGAAGDGCCC